MTCGVISKYSSKRRDSRELHFDYDLTIEILSFRAVDIDAKVCLVLNVCFEVRHLKVIVYPVHNEVGEPRGLARGLEQLVEELQAFLTEVVTEYFKTHEC